MAEDSKRYMLATNRGFVVYDTSIGLYVSTKNVNYAELFKSLKKTIEEREVAARNLMIHEQDVRILQVIA